MWDLISNYLGPLITTVTAFIFMKFILKKEIKIAPIYVVVIILLISFVISLSFFDNYMFLRTMLSCLLYLLLYKFVFKLNFFKAMFFSIIYFLLLTISELFTFLVLTQILHVSNDYLYNVFADSILSNSVMGLLSLLFGWLFRKLLIKVDNIKFKNTFQIYLVLLFVVFLFFFYITFTNIGKGIDIVAGIVVVVALLVVTMHLISQTYRNNSLLDKYDKLLEFIKKYETEIDNQRTVRHELKNQLLTIQSKILDNDKKENIIKYIDEILNDNKKTIKHEVYAKFSKLPSNGIKGLFYFKVSEAQDKGINVKVNITPDFDNSRLSNLDSLEFNQLGKILGIILDNAIEGAEVTKNKVLGIEIYSHDKKIYFVISNSYSSQLNSSLSVINKSTKGAHRGHGLLLARAIVKSNKNLSLETSVNDSVYIQTISIK